MLITNGTIVQPGLRRRTIQRQVNVGPVTLRVVTIIIFAAAALIALAQSTASATKAYEVSRLERVQQAKAKEVDEMETEATRLQALHSITGGQSSPTPSPSAPLEEPKQINYLPGGPERSGI